MDEIYRDKLIKSIIETDIILEQINKENYEWYFKIIGFLIIIIGFIIYYYNTTIDKEKKEELRECNIFNNNCCKTFF